MPAAFQIVSRASGLAVMTDGKDVFQDTIFDTNPSQMWRLEPQDTAQDCVILPVSVQGQALGVSSDAVPGQAASVEVVPTENAQIWRISRRVANPPYFFLLEGDNDLLMNVPSSSDSIQAAPRNEHANQQWTFLPVFGQLGSDG